MSKFRQNLAQCWSNIQASLFPFLEEELDPLSEKQQQLVTILELIRLEEYLPDYRWYEGRPRKTRCAIARSFVVKMVYNIGTTRALYERLCSDKSLRRICGWESRNSVPSESTFSRAFVEFAETNLPQQVHNALIKKMYVETDTVILHNSRDSTAIEVREKPIVKQKKPVAKSEDKKLEKRGRPKKGEEKYSKEPTRIEKQLTMTLEEMLNDLPTACDKGAKKDSKGNTMYWVGYKLHIDTADGCVPISAILTSASIHDSQVAIPLAVTTAGKVCNFYDLMDAAYDVPGILDHSRSLGHVPLVDKNPRRNQTLSDELDAELKRQKLIHMVSPEKIRYNERTTAERANSRLKDEFGGRNVRVRGSAKVMCHLMFGILVLAADQLLKLVT